MLYFEKKNRINKETYFSLVFSYFFIPFLVASTVCRNAITMWKCGIAKIVIFYQRIDTRWSEQYTLYIQRCHWPCATPRGRQLSQVHREIPLDACYAKSACVRSVSTKSRLSLLRIAYTRD